ncbi:MAG TPA: SDR family oxidoreductase [Candidatus Marinimicrobia bacterium]|jgi:NAD(P)-dependent dehydrogenase (short-subunit alcohol dehydrogenase family)|nr:SDR family oxidoreductase [Candidatus Neomarinimicrobiota bacterium]HHZ99924.1 SDR family oxidoreductase [Candidatus Neomarinimicrobiota bacterium]HIB02864.1 SDR family oxidoreductase [Candidatus Neomarinimicrobiota bacterium]HIB71357.1 SDR family oxidoreductase [Candidatus Neomarinimicrobiota bacterium]HIN62034.1 SDR family oxidoreductase [Candidatus Neomarinimicrobiota bacterium]
MMSVALITGCSSGFGMLSAARLSAAGHTVYASMRNLQKKEALLVEVESRGGEVKLLKLDVTDNTTIDDAINTIESERGRLDILINNAGYGLGGFFEDISEREFRDQMETNFFGVLKMTRRALPLMRRSTTDHGNVKIINISSAQGRAPIPGLGAYGTSKWALEGFSEALYHELAPFGIRVVIVEPGSYRTEIFTSNAHVAEQAENQVSPYARFSVALRRKIETMTKGGSVGMGDNPEVVAELIEKIVTSRSPKLRYVVGRQARIRILLRAVLPMNCYSGLLRKALFGSVERSFET